MTSPSAIADRPVASRGSRGPLFVAVQKAAEAGVSRQSFAFRAGLTSAEVSMLERATGVHLAA